MGWVAVAVRVPQPAAQGPRAGGPPRAQTLTIRADRPEQVQLDGDTIGEAKALRAVVRPLALVVRVG